MKNFKYEYLESKRKALLRMEKLREQGFDAQIHVIRDNLVEVRYPDMPKVEDKPVEQDDSYTNFDDEWASFLNIGRTK